jgi:hypothetical protein
MRLRAGVRACACVCGAAARAAPSKAGRAAPTPAAPAVLQLAMYNAAGRPAKWTGLPGRCNQHTNPKPPNRLNPRRAVRSRALPSGRHCGRWAGAAFRPTGFPSACPEAATAAAAPTMRVPRRCSRRCSRASSGRQKPNRLAHPIPRSSNNRSGPIRLARPWRARQGALQCTQRTEHGAQSMARPGHAGGRAGGRAHAP